MRDQPETLVFQDVANLRQLGLRRIGSDRLWLSLLPGLQCMAIFFAPIGLALLASQIFPVLRFGIPGAFVFLPAVVLGLVSVFRFIPIVTYRAMCHHAARWRRLHSQQGHHSFVGLGIGKGFAWDGIEVSVDYGLLEVRDERLCFNGSQVQFALPIGQIRDAEVRSIEAFGMPQPRLFIAWGTDDREEWVSFDFREVKSAADQRIQTEAFFSELKELIRPSRSLSVLSDEDLPIRASSLTRRPTLTRAELGKAFALAVLVEIPVSVVLMFILVFLHAPQWAVMPVLMATFFFCYAAFFAWALRKKELLQKTEPDRSEKSVPED